MNAKRRKEIEKVVAELQDKLLCLESLRDEEQEYLDNIPENLQGSERYEKTENIIDDMTNAIDEINSALENIIESINN